MMSQKGNHALGFDFVRRNISDVALKFAFFPPSATIQYACYVLRSNTLYYLYVVVFWHNFFSAAGWRLAKHISIDRYKILLINSIADESKKY
jgi:hypothetical protein